MPADSNEHKQQTSRIAASRYTVKAAANHPNTHRTAPAPHILCRWSSDDATSAT
ncbi:GH17564 [Drosophila grimshawi]|uniref:GH17564 n=1 Tax=Drosophila grimshawi TaxID=7222 RepID=B4JXI8_DROGR|nr:GH17564 [Drosophila grimshawi]